MGLGKSNFFNNLWLVLFKNHFTPLWTKPRADLKVITISCDIECFEAENFYPGKMPQPERLKTTITMGLYTFCKITKFQGIVIENCFSQFLWFFSLKCWCKGQIISRIHLILPNAYKVMCFDRNRNGNRYVKFLECDYLLVQWGRQTHFSHWNFPYSAQILTQPSIGAQYSKQNMIKFSLCLAELAQKFKFL